MLIYWNLIGERWNYSPCTARDSSSYLYLEYLRALIFQSIDSQSIDYHDISKASIHPFLTLTLDYSKIITNQETLGCHTIIWYSISKKVCLGRKSKY